MIFVFFFSRKSIFTRNISKSVTGWKQILNVRNNHLIRLGSEFYAGLRLSASLCFCYDLCIDAKRLRLANFINMTKLGVYFVYFQ